MTMEDANTILKALRNIKAVCTDDYDCKHCPLAPYGNCQDILDDIDKYKYDSDIAKPNPRFDGKCNRTYKGTKITCDKCPVSHFCV